jgi:hypothetical protein
MPEGLKSAVATNDSVEAQQNTSAMPTPHQGTSDPLVRVGDDIRSLEQEIAFLDALCRCYGQASFAG